MGILHFLEAICCREEKVRVFYLKLPHCFILISSKNRHSRAYIQFKDSEALLRFYKSYDNHAFIDAKGNEYRCVVEFAPYQKVPSQSRPDAREGTISEDPEYCKFLEDLKAMNISLDGASHEELLGK